MDSTVAAVVVEKVTLWHLLAEPSLTLHLPRFALFLLTALLLEIYCDRRRVCLSCAIPTIIVQLLTGIGGVCATYYLMTGSFQAGECLEVPWWYIPVTSFGLIVPTFYFLRGMLLLVKEQRTSHAGKRCMVIRGLIYAVSIYFAITVVVTPYRLNHKIQTWTAEQQRPK